MQAFNPVLMQFSLIPSSFSYFFPLHLHFQLFPPAATHHQHHHNILYTLDFTVKSRQALEITLDNCGVRQYSWSPGTCRRTGRLRRISCRSARETGPRASAVVVYIYIVENCLKSLTTIKMHFQGILTRFRCYFLLLPCPLFNFFPCTLNFFPVVISSRTIAFCKIYTPKIISDRCALVQRTSVGGGGLLGFSILFKNHDIS